MRFAGLVHPVQAAVEAISRRGKMCGSREGSDARPTPRPPGAPMCRPLPTGPFPALILISGIAQGPWVVEDCALAAENLMLAAYGVGLGTCWIGFAQGFLNTSEGKNALGLPATSVPVAPIIVGHPKTETAPVPRQEPEIRWVG
jgi:nitroreductase